MVRALLLTGATWSDVAGKHWWPATHGWSFCDCTDTDQCPGYEYRPGYDLIITVGWRHLVPKDILDQTPLGVIGFHSAQLPEYPGRAPVPWAILRGDTVTHNTMLYLTDEPDAGDIIDHREVPVTTASEMNRRMGETAAEMLRQHLPALLAGTAPRTPQDRSRRGPLTKANGWQLLPEDRR
jgi:hypothetical protein